MGIRILLLYKFCQSLTLSSKYSADDEIENQCLRGKRVEVDQITAILEQDLLKLKTHPSLVEAIGLDDSRFAAEFLRKEKGILLAALNLTKKIF